MLFRFNWKPQCLRFAEDAQGHEHKGKGKGGGQFAKKDGGGSAATIDRESAMKEFAAAFAKSAPGTGDSSIKDPRGDRGKIAPKKLEAALPALIAEVKRHTEKTTVGPSVHDLYDSAGQGLTPQEFRAALLHAEENGQLRLSAWGKTPADLPRPETNPIVGGTIVGYAHLPRQ